MGEQGVLHLCGKSHRCFRRKILRRDGTGQPDDAKCDQHQAHPADITSVPIGDAVIDDGRHHQRHEQLKGSLQQLEQRRQNRFLLIILQINEQLFHSFLPPVRLYQSFRRIGLACICFLSYHRFWYRKIMILVWFPYFFHILLSSGEPTIILTGKERMPWN